MSFHVVGHSMASGDLIYTSRVFPSSLLGNLRNDSSTFETFEPLDHFGAQRAFLALTKRISEVLRYDNQQMQESQPTAVLHNLWRR